MAAAWPIFAESEALRYNESPFDLLMVEDHEMGLEHVNRRGDRYYVLQGRTKTGKPKYYCSRKPEGNRVDRLPEGYEIHESPSNGVTTVRKVRPSRIVAAERELVERLARELAAVPVIIDVDGDCLVVYASNRSPAASIVLFERLFGQETAAGAEIGGWIEAHSHYASELRFTLTDEDERLYSAERWCYRSGIDGWFPLRGHKSLERIARSYLPHLGQESFYELF
jgi:hypothetical protein